MNSHPEPSNSSLRILTLQATGIPQANRCLEDSDQIPRASLYARIMGTDMLDEHMLEKAPRWRRWLYRRMPGVLTQVAEAYLLRRRYDVIVSWSDPLAMAFAALLKLTRSRMPHVALLFWISKPKKAALLKRVHTRMDAIILWTSAHREFAITRLGIPASKIHFIPYYVDEKFWRPFPGPTDMISSVGIEMRDYPTLLEAMKGLDIRCHIAAGATRGILSKTVKAIYENGPLPRNVTAGGLPALELRKLYARSRFVVIPLLPSESDNGLTVILEAMAMGKAVICSRTAGQRDVIRDGVTGLFVPQGDPGALRDAIRYLWDHPEEAERMGREGRKQVEERNTLESFIGNVKRIAEGVAGNGTIQASGEPARVHAARASISS